MSSSKDNKSNEGEEKKSSGELIAEVLGAARFLYSVEQRYPGTISAVKAQQAKDEKKQGEDKK
jgi:hypothetical protein